MSKILNNLRIGLDVDGLLACFSCGVIQRAKALGMAKHFPYNCKYVNYWQTSEKFSEVMEAAWKDPKFWLQLPKLHTEELPFIPDCYITSRFVPTEVTKEWLDKKGFPEAQVFTVSDPMHKLQICKDRQLDAFVDDYYVTVKHLRENGVNGILYHAPYQVGHQDECCDLPTIKTLKEVFNHI